MIELKTRHDVRVQFKGVALRNAFNACLFDSLDSDVEFVALEWFVSKLDSNLNSYKVESHAILTRALFLISHYQMEISFSQKMIRFVSGDGQLYFMKWQHVETLSAALYDLLMVTEHLNSVHQYNTYRQATRSITDYLSEDNQPRSTWRKILQLSKCYFKIAQIEV